MSDDTIHQLILQAIHEVKDDVRDVSTEVGQLRTDMNGKFQKHQDKIEDLQKTQAVNKWVSGAIGLPVIGLVIKFVLTAVGIDT